MLEAELIVEGVCPPETVDSLPYAEVDAVGDGRQYPADDGDASGTVDDGRYPGVGHCVSIGGG
jgi:hypothetical protein